MKSNDKARHKFAEMDVLDMHLSHIFNMINNPEGQNSRLLFVEKKLVTISSMLDT